MKKYIIYFDHAGANNIGLLIERYKDTRYIVYDWWENNKVIGPALEEQAQKFVTTRTKYKETDIEFDTKEEFLDWFTEKYFTELL